jgi:hypothetical protein
MRFALAVTAILCVLCLSWPALAGGGAATDAYADVDASAAVDAHGLLDVYALRNFNDPASGKNQLRAFDFAANRASLGYLLVTLAHRPGRVGFRVDAGVGDTAVVFEQQDPAAPTNPRLARALSFFPQAFGTVMLPLPREVELDIGRFATPVGLEDNESLTNWNYGRSLLYSWAEPSLHTGLRMTSQVAKPLGLSLYWVNGWNSIVRDGSDMRTFAGAGSFAPAEHLEVVLVDMAGPEHPPTDLGGPLAFRNLVDAYVVYAPTTDASLALAADYGYDRTGGGVRWWGASWYTRLQARPWLAGALRGEVLADPAGFVTGTPQRLAEVTITGEVRRALGRLSLIGRLEYRHDQSTARPFDGAFPASRDHQDTLTAALLAAF